MLSGHRRHRKPRQAPAFVVTAGVTGSALALPLLASTAAHGADGGTWDRLAACESGGAWSANTGNGFHGGLQISQRLWERHGGLDFAERADLASRSQQISVAENILDAQGLVAWDTCGPKVGLTAADAEPSEGPSEPSAEPSGDSSAEPSAEPGDPENPENPDHPDGRAGAESPEDDSASPAPADSASPEPGGSTSPSPEDGASPEPEGTETPSPDTSVPGEPTTNPTESDESGETGESGEADGTGEAGEANETDTGAGTPEGGPDATTPSDDTPEKPSPDESSTPEGGGSGSGSDSDSGSGSDGEGAGRHRGNPHPGDSDGAEGADGANEHPGRHSRPDGSPSPGSYTVRPGDTLSAIAERYGTKGGWPTLHDLNLRIVGADADLILPGQRLALTPERGDSRG